MTTQAEYIRFAALGDSATFGLGDPVERGWRGWARLLSDAIATAHQVSFCNLALPDLTPLTARALHYCQVLPSTMRCPLNSATALEIQGSSMTGPDHACAAGHLLMGMRWTANMFQSMTDVFSNQRQQCVVCSAMVPSLLTPLHDAWHEDDVDETVRPSMTALNGDS